MYKKIEGESVMKKYLILFCAVLFLMISGSLSTKTVSQVKSEKDEIRLPNGELPFGINYSFSSNETLATLKAKNPDVIFNPDEVFNQQYEKEGGFKVKAEIGEYPVITKASFVFKKGRLWFVQINKKGAALDVYEPLVEKYKKIYGKPKESTPLQPDSKGTFAAMTSWDNDKILVILVVAIPQYGDELPFVLNIQSRK